MRRKHEQEDGDSFENASIKTRYDFSPSIYYYHFGAILFFLRAIYRYSPSKLNELLLFGKTSR